MGSLDNQYELAILPGNATISANADDTPADYVHIASSYNIAQVVVSIVQLIASSITLYRTRGDQLGQYGYAAFGLTVLPYIAMSFVNFLGNLVTPNYEALYLVHSPELDEAKLRGARFDGTVGKVQILDVACTTPEEAGQIASFHGHGEDESKFTVAITNSISNAIENFELRAEEMSPPLEGHGKFPYLDILSRSNANSPVLEIPACTPFQTSGNNSDHSAVLTALGVIFSVIPYLVIGILTQFRIERSTTWQRVWIMMWLALDTVGYICGMPDQLHRYDIIKATLCFALMSGPAAIGLYFVGDMLQQYGNCIDINSGL